MRTGFTISAARQAARFAGNGLVWLATGLFVLNVLALIAAVVVNSFATPWLGTWLPAGFTFRWAKG
jgi:putative spermidine/putrescine transport system permease protein